ncbi:MAG: hypothetical protein U0401_01085 [Anaerolineae bacterium]
MNQVAVGPGQSQSSAAGGRALVKIPTTTGNAAEDNPVTGAAMPICPDEMAWYKANGPTIPVTCGGAAQPMSRSTRADFVPSSASNRMAASPATCEIKVTMMTEVRREDNPALKSPTPHAAAEARQKRSRKV